MIAKRELAGEEELEHLQKPRQASIDRLYRSGVLKDDRALRRAKAVLTSKVLRPSQPSLLAS